MWWSLLGRWRRRRIKTEEKEKVVASVWVAVFIKFLAALDILYQNDIKGGNGFIFSSNHPGAIHPIIQKRPTQNSLCDKELDKFFPLNRSDDLCLLCCRYSSSMGDAYSTVVWIEKTGSYRCDTSMFPCSLYYCSMFHCSIVLQFTPDITTTKSYIQTFFAGFMYVVMYL